MLPRRHRLTRPEDYRAVLRRGRESDRTRRRAGTELLVVHVAVPSSATAPATRPPRVGFVVSKAVGNSVVRHRVVRRLRALVAARLPDVPDGVDLVIRAQPSAASATSAQLGEALEHALARVLRTAV